MPTLQPLVYKHYLNILVTAGRTPAPNLRFFKTSAAGGGWVWYLVDFGVMCSLEEQF